MKKSKIFFDKIKKEFLFGSHDSIAPIETQNHLKKKIKSLEIQLSSLQQKVINLEAKLENSKYGKTCLSKALSTI